MRFEIKVDGRWRELRPEEVGVFSRTGVTASLTWVNGHDVTLAWRAFDDDGRLLAQQPALEERLR